MARLSHGGALALALPLAFLLGCTTEVGGADPLSAGRGQPSAAALEHGSCVDACGDQSSDGCWCDELCETYGDCCQDYQAACVEEDARCWSDGDCGAGERCAVDVEPDSGPCCPPNAFCIAIMPACTGTCVADAEECPDLVCFPHQAPVDTDGDGCADSCTPSGCQADEDCEDGGFCKRPEGQCYAEGTCEARADVCIDLWKPVCGCDGVTYSNDCYAAAAGVSVASQGECGLPEGSCSSDGDCGENQHCQPIMCITAPCPPGICEDNAAPAGDSCEASCGGASADGSCYCDAYCSAWGDCCADFAEQCAE